MVMTRAQSSSIPAFLVLCQIFCVVSSSQQCRDEYSIYGMMLKRHIFNKTKVSNWSACVQACNDDIRCQSMNYVISQGTCELNNRTKEARPENFVPHEKKAYMKRFTKRVPLGSIPECPAESCAEIKASEGNNAVSGNYWFDSIKPGEVVQAPCNVLVEECVNYQALISAHRIDPSERHPPPKTDRSLGPGWYRFLGDAGTKMASSCFAPLRCGTDSPGWLNGTHPTVEGGQVIKQVCFSWSSDCCYWSINIRVRNCGEYYVYYINGTPYKGSLGYCGSV